MIGCVLFSGCAKKSTDAVVVTQPRFLYVTTGQCYSGTGNTTFTNLTSSNLIYKVTTGGVRDLTIADYNSFPASVGDSAISTIEWDDSNLLVLVENPTSGRRIEKVSKNSGNRSLFTSNTTILSSVLRGMIKLNDGSILVNKSSGYEKISAQGVRIGLPFVTNNLGATCGTAITQMTSAQSLNNGKIVFSHAAAANNRFGIISSTGYSSSADCLAVQAAPNVGSFPVASVYVAAFNQLIVAYAGNSMATNINSIYVYDINETTNVISNPTTIYDASLYPSTYGYLLYGISALAFDPLDNSLYISTSVNSAVTVSNYTIEKLSYDALNKALTRVTPASFYNYGLDTKCISSMSVGF